MPEIAERTAANVVTSENLSAFMTERLNLAKPEPVAAPDAKAETKEIEPPDDVPERAEETPEQHAEKVKNSYQKLREQRNAAREEAAKVLARAEAAEAKARDLEARLAPPPPEDKPRPDKTKYTDADKYEADLTAWAEEQGALKRDKESRAAQIRDKWVERVKAAEKDMPDLVSKIRQNDVPVHPDIEQAIYQSEVGPQILLHFSEHRAEAEAMNRMPAAQMMREFGRLEARLEKTKEAPKAEVTPPVIPKPKEEPIEPLRGGTTVPEAIAAGSEFKGSFAEYKALRKAGKIK